MLLLILLLIGVCLSDDDRLVDKEDMRFGFEVWQVCVYMYITDTLTLSKPHKEAQALVEVLWMLQQLRNNGALPLGS